MDFLKFVELHVTYQLSLNIAVRLACLYTATKVEEVWFPTLLEGILSIYRRVAGTNILICSQIMTCCGPCILTC